MPRGTTRDAKTGIPVSWRRHLAARLTRKNKNLTGLRAEVEAQHMLEDDWARLDLFTGEPPDGPASA